MSFDPAWLDLREPADLAARDACLLDAAASHLSAAEPHVAVDLGCGTGSMIRALSGRVPARTKWRLVDNDPRLLALAAARPGPAATLHEADLADLDALPLACARLLTASALIDLVSAGWVEGLARRAAGHRAAIHASLNYDGSLAWTPRLPGDSEISAAFNGHQRRDKGFGPALGPDGAQTLAAAMRRHSYSVRVAASPWKLGPRQGALQTALIDGIAAAAAEAGCGAAASWAQARRAAVVGSSCIVGHLDLLALPPGASAQSNITSVSSP